MLQLIVYSLLIFLTMLAIADIVSSCMEDERIKRRCSILSAPYSFVKNRIKGIRTLKEDTVPTEPTEPSRPTPPADSKPSTIYETV